MKSITDIVNEEENLQVVIIKPNSKDQFANEHSKKVFLAGTIDFGNSEDWQAKIEKEIIEHCHNVTIFNPRINFDNGEKWENTPESFNKQVNWEQDNLEASDIIFMFIGGSSKSPISLLELGQFISSGKMIVCCENEFYRYENVRIMCERNNVTLFNDLDVAITDLLSKLPK